MKKIAFLLVSIVLLSGCWKDIATDIVVNGIKYSLKNSSSNNKEQQCEKYSTDFDWKIKKAGKTIDIIQRGNILYVLKKSSDYRNKITEIDVAEGKVLNNIYFKYNDFEKVNQNNTGPDNILFLREKGYRHMIIAYNFVNQSVLWCKESKGIGLEIVEGFLYSKDYELVNNKKIFFINRIDPVSGKEEKIYTFQDSLNDFPLNGIEDFNVYSNNAGHLYFTYVAIFKKSPNDIRAKVNVMDFATKEIKEIQSFKMNNSDMRFDCIALDDENIFVNVNDDIFCYDRYTLDTKWEYFSRNDVIVKILSLDVKGNYLFMSTRETIEAINKKTGEKMFYKLVRNEKSVGAYNDIIYFTEGEFFYRRKDTRGEMDKFISPSYCEGNNSIDIRFVVNKNGSVFLSDNGYVMKKVFNK